VCGEGWELRQGISSGLRVQLAAEDSLLVQVGGGGAVVVMTRREEWEGEGGR